MISKCVRFGFFFLYISFMSLLCAQQRLQSMEFHNQNITDILMALAEASGTSIIPDQTVTGTASFYFADSDFEEALRLFLSTYKLYLSREGNVYHVSRISVSFNPTAKSVNMKADDVDVESLIRSLSAAIGVTILYDPLPKTNLSVAIDNLPPAKALEILTRRLSDYALDQDASFFYIRKLPGDLIGKRTGSNSGITKTADRYGLSVDKARFLDLLADLFKKSGKEYSLLIKTDAILENLYFSDRDFDDLLRLILEQGNADFIVKNGVYYILELQRRDVVKKLKETRMTILNYFPAQDLPNLLPSELASSNVMKIDKNTNTVYLTGSDEEIKPIQDFIAQVDRPLDGLTYERFEIKYLKVKDIMTIIPQKLIPIAPFMIPDSNAFIVLGTPEGLSRLREYIATVDRKGEGFPVRLKYLKTDEVLKNMPPSIAKDDIIDSGYPNLFFFTGSEDKRKLFLRELAFIDKPKPQIRYELLVVQYQNDKAKELNPSFSGNSNPETAENSIVGSFSDLLSLNFDVVSQFGSQFAAKLSYSIGTDTAQVFADTTLNGLSGQEIKFQNTDTSRTQATEYDEVNKITTQTGVIKEISSGLIVSLNGWVSGDDMITININATVSKQSDSATSSDDDSSSLPSTSERVVTTQVRTPSGQPIVISGLIKDDVDKIVKKTPILGDIPLLGLLFRHTTETKSRSEVVIYIVPHLTFEGDDGNTDDHLERYYRTFVKGAH